MTGTFQADEALGVWLLRQLPKYKNSKLVRSRDNAVLEKLDIVIDVGGCYDHSKLRYDHHQRGFFETFDGDVGVAKGPEDATGVFKTKLSVTGLVYKHYGREVIQALYPYLIGQRLEAVYLKLYKDMIEGIDAIDNGIEVCDNPRYREGTGLSRRIARLNPRWNELPKLDQKGEDAKFESACSLAGEEFSEQLRCLTESWLPARDLVEAALLNRKNVDSCEQILCFERGGMPWKQHLYELEREHQVTSKILFVLYPDQSGMWRVQAVTVEGTAFKNRLSLPEAWRGLRNEELTSVSKIEGCCFCHNAGFIGGNKTMEGALKMAKETIQSSE